MITCHLQEYRKYGENGTEVLGKVFLAILILLATRRLQFQYDRSPAGIVSTRSRLLSCCRRIISWLFFDRWWLLLLAV